MEYSDLKLLSSITQVSGFLCLVFGAIAYFYEERLTSTNPAYFGHWVTNPYREYAFPLAALGIILIVIGALIHDHANREREKQQNPKN